MYPQSYTIKEDYRLEIEKPDCKGIYATKLKAFYNFKLCAAEKCVVTALGGMRRHGVRRMKKLLPPIFLMNTYGSLPDISSHSGLFNKV